VSLELQRRSRRRSKSGDRKFAIGVVRVSTSRQDIGAAAQRDELQRWADGEGVRLLAIHEDIGVSGAAPLHDRPGLLAALSAAKNDGAGLLVAVKRDRFARHRHTIADLEREAGRVGAVLVTTDGVCTGEDTELAEMTAGMQDLLAAMELRKIRARNRARARRCIAAGRTHGGYIPFGYRRRTDGIRGRSGLVVEIEPDPDQQRIIQAIVERRESGQTYREVKEWLRFEGVPSPTGKSWHESMVRRIVLRAGGRDA
jgi:DNA invertase Pin-like site-specific DNA recombinase